MPDRNGPICISVINMKGGVGKTTIAALLARHAALQLKRNVLAIDLDPQANLSQALMGQSYRQFLNDRSPSIVEVFAGYLPPTSLSPSSSTLNLDSVVRTLTPNNLKVIPSRFDFSNNLISAVTPDPQRLARLIAENFQDENLIIIDCAPTESIFTQAAYHASRYMSLSRFARNSLPPSVFHYSTILSIHSETATGDIGLMFSASLSTTRPMTAETTEARKKRRRCKKSPRKPKRTDGIYSRESWHTPADFPK